MKSFRSLIFLTLSIWANCVFAQTSTSGTQIRAITTAVPFSDSTGILVERFDTNSIWAPQLKFGTGDTMISVAAKGTKLSVGAKRRPNGEIQYLELFSHSQNLDQVPLLNIEQTTDDFSSTGISLNIAGQSQIESRKPKIINDTSASLILRPDVNRPQSAMMFKTINDTLNGVARDRFILNWGGENGVANIAAYPDCDLSDSLCPPPLPFLSFNPNSGLDSEATNQGLSLFKNFDSTRAGLILELAALGQIESRSGKIRNGFCLDSVMLVMRPDVEKAMGELVITNLPDSMGQGLNLVLSQMGQLMVMTDTSLISPDTSLSFIPNVRAPSNNLKMYTSKHTEGFILDLAENAHLQSGGDWSFCRDCMPPPAPGSCEAFLALRPGNASDTSNHHPGLILATIADTSGMGLALDFAQRARLEARQKNRRVEMEVVFENHPQSGFGIETIETDSMNIPGVGLNLASIGRIESRLECNPEFNSDTFMCITINPDASEAEGGFSIVDLDGGNDGLLLNLGGVGSMMSRGTWMTNNPCFVICPEPPCDPSVTDATPRGLALSGSIATGEDGFMMTLANLWSFEAQSDSGENKQTLHFRPGPVIDTSNMDGGLFMENRSDSLYRIESIHAKKIGAIEFKSMVIDSPGTGAVEVEHINIVVGDFGSALRVESIEPSASSPDNPGLELTLANLSKIESRWRWDNDSSDRGGCLTMKPDANTQNGIQIYNDLSSSVSQLVMAFGAESSSLPIAYMFDAENRHVTTSDSTDHTFNGDVHIDGMLSKSAGTFRIDHPLDPENKYLYHSFVESPDMMNIYNGNVVSDQKGYAIVKMPNYFSALNVEFRYQLTVVGQFAQAIIAEKIEGNQFVIQTDKPNVEVSWQVTGVRNDKFARENRVQVEVEKNSINR